MPAVAFPLYQQLITRAKQNPVERPDWEQYWRCGLTLAPVILEVILALVYRYRMDHTLPADIIRPLPGGRGVALNTEKLPYELQQIILLYLNQV
jgi:hypothetical protein